METKKALIIAVVALGLIVWSAKITKAAPLDTAFTYQGHLYDANNVADGLYDFQFKLFDGESSGNKLGPDINKPEVDVIDGNEIPEPFGDPFGRHNWLLVHVRPLFA